MTKQLVRPAYEDPNNSVDLFDADRLNEFGETYCVAPAILSSQIGEQWQWYLEALDGDALEANKRPVEICSCDRCHTIFNGLIGGFVCPECGDDSPTTDLSMSDVFTPWAGASNAENDAAAEEMYEALRDGKTF